MAPEPLRSSAWWVPASNQATPQGEYAVDTLWDVVGYVVGGLVVAGVAIAVLFYYVRPAGAIWRGNASRMPLMGFGVVTVTPLFLRLR